MAGTCGGRGYVISTSHPSVPNPPVPERGTSDPAHPVRSCIPAATQSRAIWAADLPPSSCPPCDPNRQGAPRYRATRLNWRSSQPLVTYSLAHKYTKSQRPLFGRSGRRGALNGSLRRVSFSCWPGAIGCVCVWWSGSRVVRGTARWCGSTRSTWRVHQGYTAGVRGLLCPVVCLGMPGVREGPAGWCSRGRSPAEGNLAAGGASACGFGELYGPVRGCPQDRRRGWPGARTYSGQRRRRGHHEGSFSQVRGHMEVQAGAVCKTVGSAYVGSNPTPATTCENGPLAAETRPGGPFPSCHDVYPCVLTSKRAVRRPS